MHCTAAPPTALEQSVRVRSAVLRGGRKVREVAGVRTNLTELSGWKCLGIWSKGPFVYFLSVCGTSGSISVQNGVKVYSVDLRYSGFSWMWCVRRCDEIGDSST